MRRGAPTVRNFSLWQVVRVEFPYADQPVTRKRPALVIAIPDIAKSFRLLWLIMITSARHDSWLGDVVISDLSSAGLSRPSYVRTTRVAVLDARYAEPIGQRVEADRAEVARQLRRWLGPAMLIA